MLRQATNCERIGTAATDREDGIVGLLKLSALPVRTRAFWLACLTRIFCRSSRCSTLGTNAVRLKLLVNEERNYLRFQAIVNRYWTCLWMLTCATKSRWNVGSCLPRSSSIFCISTEFS